MADLAAIIAGLTDVVNRRQTSIPGGSPHRFIELLGGLIVETLHYEPDPVTYRGCYYYNSIVNRLYRKVVVVNLPEQGIVRAHWTPISQ